MTKGRRKESDEQIAAEAYAVLIRREKASRVYSKALLIERLKDPAVYIDFLKLCLDYDRSADLVGFRRGLGFVVRVLGAGVIAKRAGFSRMSLYRMLAPAGNPRLKNFMALFRALKLHPWFVDDSFMKRQSPFLRPKLIPVEVPFGLVGKTVPLRR